MSERRALSCSHGAQHLAAALAGGVADGVLPAGEFGSDGVGGVGGGTLVVAPEECLQHRTAPEPLVRSGRDPPPENVNRLHVLTHPGARFSKGVAGVYSMNCSGRGHAATHARWARFVSLKASSATCPCTSWGAVKAVQCIKAVAAQNAPRWWHKLVPAI